MSKPRDRAGAGLPSGEAGTAERVADVVRTERRAVLATLVRVTGRFDLAEDAVQDASLSALATWSRDGLPRHPRAWLTTTARHRVIDRLRREAARTAKEKEAVDIMMSHDDQPPPDSVVNDDLLRLVFTCCHPSLSPEAQVALSLRTLGGLTTPEVARALLVSEATMTKRLTRARQKIARAAIPYRVPADHELPERVGGVAATVYLIFNEGYVATAGDDHLRPDLAAEAVRLARLLTELMPDEPRLLGLLALLLLQHARREARLDLDGDVVLLADQDRAEWKGDEIGEGIRLTAEAIARTPETPDSYIVQAAIAACHALAPDYRATDWMAIVAWYDVLLTINDTPVVRLNRAAAVAESEGAATALELVDDITGLEHYPWWHATRAVLLERLDRPAEADRACKEALALPLTAAQRRFLTRPPATDPFP